MVRPEIVDLVAWLELVADATGVGRPPAPPRRGPRYRIGVTTSPPSPVTRRGDRRTRRRVLADALADARRRRRASPYDGARRLTRSGRRAPALAAAGRSRLPVLDLAETIVQRTGLWQAAGDAGRENLLRFLDLAERFAPVEGDPGLPAFLEYLHLLDESEEDVAEAHPTDVDAVKVMTIHQAKGLEYPYVYVPGLAGGAVRGSSPTAAGGENPLTSGAALPWWLQRGRPRHPRLARARRPSRDHRRLRERASGRGVAPFYVACTAPRRGSSARPPSGTRARPSPRVRRSSTSSCRPDRLVTERFRHEPAAVDPVAASERQRGRRPSLRSAGP